MATIYKNLSDHDPAQIPSGKGFTFAIVVSEWNSNVTSPMAEAARARLLMNGVAESDIAIYYVPGSFELIYASANLSRGVGRPNAVIAIGCVVRGETPHFDYISEAVANNIGHLNVVGDVPIIFGVLTTDTMQQALDRAGGRHGNKGDEAAVTALKMVKVFGR